MKEPWNPEPLPMSELQLTAEMNTSVITFNSSSEMKYLSLETSDLGL